MRTFNDNRNRKRTSNVVRLLMNFALVCVFLLAAAVPVQAQDTQPQPPVVADPYDSWTEEFTDFIPPAAEPVQMSQPDGASFKAVLTPMETGGQVETEEGYTILQNAEGWWVYAQPGDTPDTVVPSTLVVGKDLPYGLAKKLGQAPSMWDDGKGGDKRDALFEAVKDVSSPNNSIFTANDFQPKIYRYLVVLVEFQDVKFQPGITAEWVQNQISELGQSPTGSVTDLYHEMSYGKFIPYFDVIGPITSDYTMAAHDYQLPGGRSVSTMINTEIGAKIKDLVDWEQYDNDKVVYTSQGQQYRSADMVVVIHAGPGKEATGQPGQIWSHASTANFRTGYFGEDGRELRIRAVNTCPEIGFNIGVVAHEMGHSIGEPDYYATSYNNAGTGDWDLMAGGSWIGDDPAGSNPVHLNPYSKINQGWVEPLVVDGTMRNLELRPRELYPDLIKIPLGGAGNSSVGAEEMLFVEYVSNRVPGAIFDKAAYGSGLLIWHYDRGGSQNNPARPRMDVEEYDFRDGTQELTLNLNRGEPTDVWTDTPVGMTPFTFPNTGRDTPLVAGGSLSTGWSIANISALEPVMSLDIFAAPEAAGVVGLDIPGLVQQPVVAGSGPADLTTKVYNLTNDPLANVLVQFFATIGEKEVLVAETTVASLPAGYPTQVTATWANPVAGKFVLTAKATAGEDTAVEDGVVRVFERPASVLIVDDDDGYKAEEAYEGVLASLGVPYHLVERTAGLATLSQYELVIWEAGQAGRQNGQLNAQERADLKAFLDAGGKLWMTSPRLGAAMASTSAAPGVDAAMYRDYFGSGYPMSNQMGGGTIYGLGHLIGGTGSYELRQFPGRAIQDFITQETSSIGTVTPLFDWSYGTHLGMEVTGDAAHNNFHVVYFGFNLSQVIHGADRMALTQQVLDSFGIRSVYFDMNTYLVQKSGSVKVTVHDPSATAPEVTVNSDAQPAGVQVMLEPTDVPGTFTGVVNVQKTTSNGSTLKVNNIDTLRAVYEAPGVSIWDTSAVLLKVSQDQPATLHHDDIAIAKDANDLPVMAVATDDIRVQKVELYYRVAGSGKFIFMPMTATFRDAYTAVIPASAVTPMGVEYYVLARDSKGTLTYHGTAAEPLYVVVQPRTLGQ